LALYAVLGELGIIGQEELKTFCSFGSRLGGHPDRTKVPGVLVSSGSLGHGVPIAAGIALSKRIKDEPGRVFVLAGDGELNEGSVWEAAMIASHHNLDNLTLIIDANESSTRALDLGSIENKLAAFGFIAAVVDGHSHEELVGALRETNKGRPHAIVARTIKGKGLPAMEQNPAWHHRTPSESELISFLDEVV
jgi:transketolase